MACIQDSKLLSILKSNFPRLHFQEKIKQEFGIECFMPANGETATIKTPITIAASISAKLLKEEAQRFDARPDERAFKRYNFITRPSLAEPRSSNR